MQWEAAFQLFREGLKLLIGDLELAIENNYQASGTGIPKASILDCDVALENGRKNCAKVQALFHLGEDCRLDLIAQQLAEVSRTEEFAQRSVRFDRPKFRRESQFGMVFSYGRGELNLEYGVPADQPFDLLFSEQLHARPTFVMKVNDHEAGGLDRGKRGVLDLYAVPAAVVFIEFGAEQGGQILLKI